MKTTFIYALKDPETGEVRYVGKSDNPKGRLSHHKNDAKRGIKSHRVNWIASCLRRGSAPVLEILDEVSNEEWASWEAAYIEFFWETGCDLVNATGGGEGVFLPGEKNGMFGKHHSPEACEKCRAPNVGERNWGFGKKVSAEHLANITKGINTPEVIEKISRAARGRIWSPESRERAAAAKRGDKNPNFGKRSAA